MDKLVKIVCILILTSIFDRTDATLNLLIDGQQDYLEYKNSSYMLFKELFARIHLQCVGSKPTTFEVQMHRRPGNSREISDWFNIWSERDFTSFGDRRTYIYSTSLSMVLLNEPQITLSLTCLYAQNSSVDGDVSSDAVTLRGHVVKDNGTDKVFYAIDPEGEPKLAYLGQRNESECEIEHVMKSISPTKVEWNCRWKGEEYYGKNWDIEGAKFCRRIPECHRYYPKEKTKKKKTCIRILEEDEPCHNCLVISTLVSSVMIGFVEDFWSVHPIVYSVVLTNGLPQRFFNWSWSHEQLEMMTKLKTLPSPLYIGDVIEFECTVSETYFSFGTKFGVRMKDSQSFNILNDEKYTVDSFLKNDVNHRVYTLKIKIHKNFLNVVEYGCFAPVWNTADWINKTHLVQLENATRPSSRCPVDGEAAPEIKIIPMSPAIFSIPSNLVLDSKNGSFKLNCSFSDAVKWSFSFDKYQDDLKSFQIKSGRRWLPSSVGLSMIGSYSNLEYFYVGNGLRKTETFVCQSILDKCKRSSVTLTYQMMEKRVVVSVDDFPKKVAYRRKLPTGPDGSKCIQLVTVRATSSTTYEWMCQRGNGEINVSNAEFYCSDPLTCGNFFENLTQRDECIQILTDSENCHSCREKKDPGIGTFVPRYLRCGLSYQYSFFSVAKEGDGIPKLYFRISDANPDLMLELVSLPSTIYRNKFYNVICRISHFYFGLGAVLSIESENKTFITDDRTASLDRENIRTLSVLVDASQFGQGFLKVTCSAPVIFSNSTWITKNQTVEVLDPQLPTFLSNSSSSSLIELNVGDSTSLDCQSKGVPTPQVTWEVPQQSLSLLRNTNLEILNVQDVKFYYSGIYKCTAFSEVGNISRLFEINVAGAPLSKTSMVVITLGSILIAILLIFLACYVRRFRRIRSFVHFMSESEVAEFITGVERIPFEVDGNEIYMPEISVPYNTSFEIAKENLILFENTILGQGEYGVVYKGSIRSEADYNYPEFVAIKTNKANVNLAVFKAILAEIKVLSYLGDNENIVKFYGACTEGIRNGEVFIVIELCERGSLIKFLRCNRESFTKLPGESDYDNLDGARVSKVCDEYQNVGAQFSAKDLLRWSLEIVSAMSHLEELKIIHGDIAARNVLLTRNLTTKLSDFGLSKQLNNYSTYVKTSKIALPWRWMAVEALRDMSFSTKSDIWSFAVTVWEIYSLGEIPYPGLNWHVDFCTMLTQGLRLQKPQLCGEEMYQQLLNCWNTLPQNRPMFQELKTFLQQLQSLDK